MAAIETFIFDNIVHIAIIIITTLLYIKTKELYSLSLQKGIKYLNIAMLFLLFNIVVKYIITLLDFILKGAFITSPAGLVFSFLNMYVAAMGGFYLAYCLVWRRFEKKNHTIIFNLAAIIIPIIDLYLIVQHNFITAYLFFTMMITVLLYAIISNYKLYIGRISKDINPFLSLVGLGLSVYVVNFIEALLIGFLFTIHFYAWGLATVFSLALLYNVIKITK